MTAIATFQIMLLLLTAAVLLALVARRANDAEGRTVAGRGEGAGVGLQS